MFILGMGIARRHYNHFLYLLIVALKTYSSITLLGLFMPNIVNYKQYRLTNGLEFSLYDSGYPSRAFSADFIVKSGDMYAKSGVAHLLEHSIMEQSLIPKTAKESRNITPVTITPVTGEDYIYFHVALQELKYLENFLRFISRNIFEFQPKVEFLDQAKSDVLRQIEESESDDEINLDRRLLQELYLETPIRYSVYGDPQTVKEAGIEDVATLYRNRFKPRNMKIIITGKLGNFDPIAELVARYLERYRLDQEDVPEEHLPLEPPRSYGKFVEEPINSEEGMLVLGHRVPNVYQPDFPASRILNVLLGHFHDSALERRLKRITKRIGSIYNRSLAEAWMEVRSQFEQGSTYLVLNSIFGEYARVQLGELYKSEFERAKRAYLVNLTSPLEIVRFEQRGVDLNSQIALAERVNQEDVIRSACNYLTLNNTVGVIGIPKTK